MSRLIAPDEWPHIGPELRENFQGNGDFLAFIREKETPPLMTAEQLERQILMADLYARCNAIVACILSGTVGTATTMTDVTGWRPNFRPPDTVSLPSYYVVSRPPNDMDLIAAGLRTQDPGEKEPPIEVYNENALSLLKAITAPSGDPLARQGQGLGGLYQYVLRSTRLVGKEKRLETHIDAHPTYRGFLSERNPVRIELEFKRPANNHVYRAVDQAKRSIIAIEIPGLADIAPQCYPAAAYLGDNLAELVSAPEDPKIDAANWRGYKLLANSICALMTHEFQIDQVREAIRGGRFSHRLPQGELPDKMIPYGDPRSHAPLALPWRKNYEQLRATEPRLRHYPDYFDGLTLLQEFRDGLYQNSMGTWKPIAGWQQLTQITNPGLGGGPGNRPSTQSPRSGFRFQ